MWPRALDRLGRPAALPKLSRRAWLIVAGGLAAMTLFTLLTAWLSVLSGQSHGPVYGSQGAGPARVWTWDGTDFTLAPTAATGPTSTSADLAFDRAHGVAVLWDHGCTRIVMGFTGGCQGRVDQTWTWGGTAWTKQGPRSSPIESGPGTMLYDPKLQAPVYISGAGRAWAWEGSTWRALDLRGGPQIVPPGVASKSPPSIFAAGYDDALDRLVFVLSDRTWTWDGARWTTVAGGIDFADSRGDPHAVFDAATNQLVYAGKRFTWTWDGSAWSKHEQPAIDTLTQAYDPVRKALVLVQQDTSACDKTACRTAVWTWSGTAWTAQPVTHPALLPLTRSGGSPAPMAFDEARGVMVLFVSPN